MGTDIVTDVAYDTRFIIEDKGCEDPSETDLGYDPEAEGV